MDNKSWQENEIAQAYDSKFHLLEAARREYEQSIKDLIRGLQEEMEVRRGNISLKDGVQLNIAQTDNNGFARQTEPPREFRRLFGVSHAAVAGSVSLR